MRGGALKALKATRALKALRPPRALKALLPVLLLGSLSGPLLVLGACSDPERIRDALRGADSSSSVADGGADGAGNADGTGGAGGAGDGADGATGADGADGVAAGIDTEGLAVEGAVSEEALAASAPVEGGAVPPLAPAAIGEVPDVYVVQRGDTLFAVSRLYGLPLRSIIALNELAPPYHLQAGQELALPQQRVHQVQAGETLYGISRAYEVDVSSLSRLNGLEAPFAIQAGQALLVPGAPGGAGAGEGAPKGAGEGEGAPKGAGEGAEGETAAKKEAATEEAGALDVPKAEDDLAAPPAKVSALAAPTEAEPAPPPAPLIGGAKVSPLSDVSDAADTADTADATGAAGAGSGRPAPRVFDSGEPPPRKGPGFLWPLEEEGRVLARFGPQTGGLHNDGLNIAAGENTPIVAAESGIVAYVGDDLKGFGQLLLLRHQGGWVTAYAHAEHFDVAPGQVVERGQAIGAVGQSGGVEEPQLHFEIRRKTQAVDPLSLLRRS